MSCDIVWVMAHFSKIVDSILDSTLWEECPEARLVFLGMTFASDLDGELLTRTKSALARRLNLSEEYLDKGLAVLTAPDPNSANPEYEGRRVVPIEGGWLVVSKRRYVESQTKKQARWAEQKANWRARRALQYETDGSHSSDGVTPPLSDEEINQAAVLMSRPR